MPEVLKLAQLGEHDGVTQVDVGRRRVQPELHPQLAALVELARETAPGSET